MSNVIIIVCYLLRFIWSPIISLVIIITIIVNDIKAMISTLCFHVVVLIIIVIFAISTIALAGQSSLDSSLVNSAGPDKSGNL